MKNHIHQQLLSFFIFLCVHHHLTALTPKNVVPKKEQPTKKPIVEKQVVAQMPLIEQHLKRLANFTLKADKPGFDSYMLKLVTLLEPTSPEQRTTLKTAHAEEIIKIFKEMITITDDKTVLSKAKPSITKFATILGITIDTTKIPDPTTNQAPAQTPQPATPLTSPEALPTPTVIPAPTDPAPAITTEPQVPVTTPDASIPAAIPTPEGLPPTTPTPEQPVPPAPQPVPEETPVTADPSLMPPVA